jgi:hypothetical protein
MRYSTFPRRLRSLIRAAIAVEAVLLLAPAAAVAADTVIGFDDLSETTDVTSQYHDQGVDFNLDASGASRIRFVGAIAHSDGQILDISGCSHEFCNPQAFVRARFTGPHNRVLVYVGDWGPPSEMKTVTLTALNGSGTPIATSGPATVIGGGTFSTPLEITRPTTDIASIEVGGPAGVARIGFDDLTFDAPSSPPPPLPSPPSVTISSPVPGQRFATPPNPLHVIGTVSAPGGIEAFCVAGPGNQPSIPATCDQVSAVAPDGTFDATLSAIGTGPNFVSAWVRDKAGQVAHQELVIQVASGARLSVNGIDITQGIQTIDMAQRAPSDDTSALDYLGVTPVVGARTIVRVYANAIPEPGHPTVPSVGALLYGCRGKTLLPGGPLSPERGLRALPFGFPGVSFPGERVSPTNAYTFTLPASWTGAGDLRLKAQVFEAGGGIFGPEPPPKATCATDGGPDSATLELRRIRFVRTHPFSIHPVQMYVKSEGFPPPGTVFDRIRAITPVAEGDARLPLVQGFTEYFPGPPPRWKYLGHDTEYEGWVDISDIKADLDAGKISSKDANKATLDRLVHYVNHGGCGYGCGSVVVGVTSGTAFGLTRHRCGDILSEVFDTSCPNDAPTAVVTYTRPLTSVAHELYHGLGRKHASTACGGGTGGQEGEDWPPDQVGLIEGVGLDPRPGSGGTAGPYGIVYRPAPDPGDYVPKPGVPAKEWFDFMSYCASPGRGDFNSWTSVPGWEKTVAALRAGPGAERHARLHAAGGPVAPGLHVQATDDGGAVTIDDVAPLTAPPLPAAAAGRYHLVARDASGAVLADTVMAEDPTHVDGSGGLVLLAGQVPAPRAVSVEILRDATVVATRTRSEHAPVVRILAPSRGQVVGRRGTAQVRWRATDADAERLTAYVEYTRDRGRTFKPVFAGPASAGRVTLPSNLLSHSARGRVRVRVSDGFTETATLSAPFVAIGGPPAARIVSPAPGERIAADAALAGQAEAWDDAPRPLTGRALHWFDGRHLVATGAHPSILGLRPGRRTLRLVARDRSGRATFASVRIRVLPVRPLFLELHAPASVPRRARTLKVTVASTVAATLKAGGRRFAVGRRARGLRVPFRHGSTLMLTLIAAGKTSKAQLTVVRRSTGGR